MKRNVRRVLVPTGAAAVVGVIVTTLIVGNGSGPVRAADGDASAPNTVSVSGLGRVTGTGRGSAPARAATAAPAMGGGCCGGGGCG